jgi:hypothetical protein
MSEHIAAVDVEVKFPDRDRHRTIFEHMLGDAYAAEVKTGGSVAFLYLGQTSPEETHGLVTQLAIVHPGELLAAIVNVVKTAKAAGRIHDTQIEALLRKLSEIVE